VGGFPRNPLAGRQPQGGFLWVVREMDVHVERQVRGDLGKQGGEHGVGVVGQQQHRCGLGQQTQPLVRRAQPVLGPPLLGDLLDDDADAGGLAVGVGDREPAFPPHPPDAGRFRRLALDDLVGDGLARLQHPAEDRLGVGVEGRDDLGDGLADVVPGGDAVHLGQRPVDVPEPHLGVEDGDAHRGRGDEVVEGRQRPLLLPLPRPPLGHVPEHQHRPTDAAALVPDRGGAVVNGSLRAVLRDEERVVRKSDNRSFPERPEGRVLDRLAGVLVDDAEHPVERLPGGVILAPPGQLLGDGVEVGDVAAGVGREDGIADAGERDPQVRLPLGQRLLGDLAGGDLRLGPPPGRVQRLEQGNRAEAHDGVEGEADLILRLAHGEGVSWLQDEERHGQSAGHERQEGRATAPVPSGKGDGQEEGDEREAVAENGLQQQAQADRSDHGGECQAVGSGTSSHDRPSSQCDFARSASVPLLQPSAP
jgi:hypothetical protein